MHSGALQAVGAHPALVGNGAAAAILLATHTDLDRRRLRRRADDEDVADAVASLSAQKPFIDEASDAALQIRMARTRALDMRLRVDLV
jgi:hypothetical protein